MDIVQGAIAHAAAHDSLAYGLAALAGLITSVGPCVAPRYLAVASMSPRWQANAVSAAALVCGTVVASICIAVTGSLMMRLVGASPVAFLALAVAFAVTGLRSILSEPHHTCRETRVPPEPGSSFFLGLITSLSVSPCCTPVLLAFGSLTGGTQSIGETAALVTAFTVGHVAPVAVAATAGSFFATALSRHEDALATIKGAVLFALGAYYAVLA